MIMYCTYDLSDAFAKHGVKAPGIIITGLLAAWAVANAELIATILVDVFLTLVLI